MARHSAPSGELICGAAAIGRYLGLSRRKVYYLAERAELPLLRVGRIIHARRATLEAWLAEREAAFRATTSACLTPETERSP